MDLAANITVVLSQKDYQDLVDDAFFWIAGISAVLLVGIMATMFLFLFKYSRKRNPKATQIEGNTILEITWILIPVVIVLFMFFKGYEGFEFQRTTPEDAMRVQVVGQSWFWTFIYPEEKITSDRLYLPKGRKVVFEITAPPEDVIHSFYLPDFRIKQDCVPGQTHEIWIEPKVLGEYNVFCAEYCGRDHARMITKMIVLEPDDYEAWVRRRILDQRKPVEPAPAMDPGSAEITGRDAPKLYNTYCASCHGKKGLGGLVEGSRNFTSLEGWTNGPTLAGIYKTLEEGLEGTQMRSFSNLPPWDRFALAHYVRAFYPGTDQPKDTLEAIEALIKTYRLDEQPEIKDTLTIEEAMKRMDEETRAAKDGKE